VGKLVRFESAQLRFELIKHKVVSSCFVLPGNDNRMPKMDEVVVNVRHMEDLLDRFYGTWTCLLNMIPDLDHFGICSNLEQKAWRMVFV
jgi:hypothetical protein